MKAIVMQYNRYAGFDGMKYAAYGCSGYDSKHYAGSGYDDIQYVAIVYSGLVMVLCCIAIMTVCSNEYSDLVILMAMVVCCKPTMRDMWSTQWSGDGNTRYAD